MSGSVSEREKGRWGVGSRRPPAVKAPARRERGHRPEGWARRRAHGGQRRRGSGNEEKQNKKRGEEKFTGGGRRRQCCDGSERGNGVRAREVSARERERDVRVRVKKGSTAVHWTKARQTQGRAVTHGSPYVMCFVKVVRTVRRTAVCHTVRTYCLQRTVVRPCGTAVRHPRFAQVTKNLKKKKRKTLKRPYPTFFCFFLLFFFFCFFLFFERKRYKRLGYLPRSACLRS